MKIMPTHSLGFLNLWILMFLFALPILVTVITKPQIFSATSEQFRNKKNSSEFRFFIAAKFFMLFYFIYSFFVPFSSNSSLFIAGAVVYLFGFSFYIAAWVIISKTGPNKLFTTGPFRFSRHPVYVSSFVMFLGAGIISSSLLFLIISILVWHYPPSKWKI